MGLRVPDDNDSEQKDSAIQKHGGVTGRKDQSLVSTSPREKSITLIRVDVPLPRRSLLVFSGAARYEWEHAILESSVAARRVSLTVRELSTEHRGTRIGDQIESRAVTAIPNT